MRPPPKLIAPSRKCDPMPNRAARTLPALLLALLLVPALPGAQGQPPSADTTLFVRPANLDRIVADPWLGGAWLGTTSGAFHKDLATGEIQHHMAHSGLASPYVIDVAPTADAVWLATGAGVSVLDRSGGQARHVRASDGVPLGISNVLLVEGGNVWVGTSARGLFRIDPATLVATPVPNPMDGKPFEKGIMGLAADGPELFVSVLHHGLVTWHRGTGQSRLFDHHLFAETPQYQRIVATPQVVWIATVGDGTVAMSRSTGKVFGQWSSPSTINAPNVGGMVSVGDEVWFATGGGVSRYTSSTQTWQNWRLGTAGTGSQDVAFVEGTLYAINDRQVWGFDRASATWSVEPWWTTRMVRHNTVQSCTDEGRRLAFGTGGGGLNFLDLSTGGWVLAGPEDGNQGWPRDINILDVANDGQTRWLTTHNGVSQLNLATGVYTNYYTDGRVGNGHGHNVVRDVALDGDTVWFATSSALQPKGRAIEPEGAQQSDVWNRGNVARMDKGTLAMELYHVSSGLSSENVTAVVPDGDRVWVGSRNGGLDSLDKASKRITHVYPQGGTETVLQMLLRPEGLWLATAGSGLVLVDTATLQARQVPGFSGVPVTSMAWGDGLLWVGTAGLGLRTVDPATLSVVDSYSSGSPIDVWANCMLAANGILYIGSNWGVERFDMELRRYLPQIIHWDASSAGAGSTAALGGTGDVWLAIGTPAAGERLDPAAPLRISGTASAPEGSRVLARADDGPWTEADGIGSWNVTLPEDTERFGPVTLAVRLESPGRVLAFATRTVLVGDGEADAERPAGLHHAPILEAERLTPLRFTVSADASLQGLGGQIHLRRPGSTAFEVVPLVRDASGNLSAAVPAFEAAGNGEYRIRVQWEGGEARFPAPLSGFGPTYPVIVRSATGQAAARIVPAAAALPEVPSGTNGLVAFTLQNIGARGAAMDLAFEGPAAAWLVQPPASAEIPAGESRSFDLTLQVPAGVKAGQYALDVHATPDPRIGTPAQHRFTVTVAGLDEPDARGAPMPTWIILAALALAGLARRRREA